MHEEVISNPKETSGSPPLKSGFQAGRPRNPISNRRNIRSQTAWVIEDQATKFELDSTFLQWTGIQPSIGEATKQTLGKYATWIHKIW